jgi:hypothetical protein
MNEDAEKLLLEYVYRMDGQLMGAMTAIRALILAAPDPQATASQVSEMLDKFVDAGLPHAVEEDTLDGARSVPSFVLPSREDWLEAGFGGPAKDA